jgi:NTE family protein
MSTPGKGTRRKAPHRIALALQGGGSHGAFTWGVLDRLLEEPDFEIVEISGTSAGAMNAGALADGLRRGGLAEGRAALDRFWGEIGRLPGFASMKALFGGRRSGSFHFDDSPLFLWFDMMSRVWSPYQTNPFNKNPLRPVLETLDLEGLRTDPRAPRVWICATNVRTGARRIFDNAELTPDVFLASACLPHVFQAVEIDGEAYWDGGYSGNPALSVLFEETEATDLVIIGINPFQKEDKPTRSRDIISRIDQISFNSTFLLELKAIARIEALVEAKALKDEGITPLFMHRIAADEELTELGASSKLNNDLEFLQHLRMIGRTAAERWLADHRDSLGKRSSLDLESLVSGTRREKNRARKTA